MRNLQLFMFAGDLSADRIGGDVMRALTRSCPNITFHGIGGESMRDAGLREMFNDYHLSHIGIWQSLKHGISGSRRIRRLRQAFRVFDGNALVTIDMASVSSLLAKDAAAKACSAFHIVAPTVWAWKSYRAKRFAQHYQAIYCLFPFEPGHFTRHGGQAFFYGHPQYLELPPNYGHRDPALLLMPGSRRQEIDALLPIYMGALEKLGKHHRPKRICLPAIPHELKRVKELLAKSTVSVDIIPQSDRFAAMRKAQFAIASMGTGTIELALLGTPHISTYKVDRVTQWFWMAVKRTRHLHVINKMANRGLIPEIYQSACTAETLAAYIASFANADRRKHQQLQCAPWVKQLLHKSGKPPADMIAADIVKRLAKGAR